LYRRKGDFEQALADVDKAIRMRDEDYYQFILRGNINLWRKEYEEATRDYAAAIRQNPLSAIAYSRRGETYNLLYEYQLAREDFNRAIEINPLMSFEYKDRARSSFCLHDYQAALDDLKTALELHPSDTSTLVWIPPALVAECPDESFRKGFLHLADTAIEKSNDPTRTRHYRIRVYLALNELDKARSDFAALPTPDNTQHLDYYQHALLCLVMGDSAKYRESCQAMLDALAETEDPIAANFVAWTCSLATDAVDDFQRAIALVSAAADARQESGPILYSIGGVGANLRRAGLAGSGINARQELDQIVMGAILHRAGRHEEAIQRLTELERQFESPDRQAESSAAYTAYFLAMACQKTGSEEQARVFLNKANQWTDEVLADKEKPGAWGLRATLEILRKEAEALVGTDDQESADNDQ
jgi:tetratricopeptide (TPR) repeat protein